MKEKIEVFSGSQIQAGAVGSGEDSEISLEDELVLP